MRQQIIVIVAAKNVAAKNKKINILQIITLYIYVRKNVFTYFCKSHLSASWIFTYNSESILHICKPYYTGSVSRYNIFSQRLPEMSVLKKE